MQEVEAFATVASLNNPEYAYPRTELDRLWKLLLLNQFHDVLPGSSINAVYKDALEYYEGLFFLLNYIGDFIVNPVRSC